MAQRPIWRGHLRLALVSCPVALYSAQHDAAGLHFHLINPATGNRVRMVTLDAETDQELSRRDLAKGYEFEKDRYVLLDEADFDQARVESSAVISIERFVPAASIDPIYFDTGYYMAPDGKSGADVFVVLREAIADSRRIALSRVVIARRERAIALRPMGDGLVAHTLHDANELYDSKPLFADIPAGKPDADMVKLAQQLIERQSGTFEPAATADRYEARLRQVIEAKLRGEGITPETPSEPDRGNVIDLMAALKRSLGQTPAAAPKPRAAAKPAAAKPRKPAPAAKRKRA